MSAALTSDVALLRSRAETAAAALPPLAHRDYSIASIPASGRIELIVRRCDAADGLPGLGSGWLIEGAPLGGRIALGVGQGALAILAFLPEAEREPWGLHEMHVADPDGVTLIFVQVPDSHPLRRDSRD